MSLDILLAWVSELLDAVRWQIERREPIEWIAYFAPILIFLEVPRYYLPLFGLFLARWLGLGASGERQERRRRFLLERAPLVSVVIACRNEGEIIEAALHSLEEQDYPNLEILLVDDASDDATPVIGARWARSGRIRLVRNRSSRGRVGRPSATNLGTRVARGEYIVSLDADTTLDRGAIRALLAEFADPEVGVVAGNVLARNADRNVLTRLQTLEYAVSIDLHKRWTDLLGCTLQASGAIGAFRASAVRSIDGWKQELAEDADISLRMIKAGWRVAFAPRAVALTEVPHRLRTLIGQRTRWDRGALRTYFHKHGRLLRPRAGSWSIAAEMASEWMFTVFATLAYPFYVVWLLSSGLHVYLFVNAVCVVFYAILSLAALFTVARISRRVERPWTLIDAALLTPFYKGFFRWVRLKALVLEIARYRYEDPYLPDPAWVHSPRY